LRFFAAADARLVPAANIAPARSSETPSRRAMLDWIAAKPGCFFVFFAI
jgi:hypothetical protein